MITSVLMQNYTLSEALQLPRIHHQLAPDLLRYGYFTLVPKNNFFSETRLSQEVLNQLEEKHKHETQSGGASAVVQAIYKNGDKFEAVSDSRKGGRPDGF